MSHSLHELGVELHRLVAAYGQLHERQQLRRRPWLEDILHWSTDGSIHGRLIPGERGPRSVTSDGWCPGGRSSDRPFG